MKTTTLFAVMACGASIFLATPPLAAEEATDALPPVVSPAERTFALPPSVAPPAYELELKPGGGFVVSVKGQVYRIESSYSYPHGGENRLVAGPPDASGEETWKVETKRLGETTYRVNARGKYYAIDRRLEVEPTRVMVRDTIRNTSADVLGIILGNHINTRGAKELAPTMMNKLTAFVHAKENGVGIIALDDLYQIQERPRFADGLAELRTEHFGLDKGASYTIEWAVYPTATADYYDFINQVRRDEGINHHVDGAFSFVPRREPPTAEFVDRYHLKYASLPCLGFPPDDPTVSLEGVEFPEYIEECRLIKETFAKTKRKYPGTKVMFHVAHGLYACGDPEKRFPDSRVIRADGRQIMYGGDNPAYYGRFFSKKRVEEGWRWWIFYPTLENSFGKAMIEATRHMVDELGATGMWADGFLSGYASVDGNPGAYSYDRWDGHSVDIDPKTKLVTRKKTCVPWVSLPVLKKVVRMIAAGGGVTITNEGPDYPLPRSLWNEQIINSCEGTPGAVIALHLGRVPASLGTKMPDSEGVYRDILKKLDQGSLYFWLFNNMDRKTLVEHMYPMTIESIHAGTVRGKQRIVTKNSGVYGWQGDRSLHIVYRYDADGRLDGNNFATTVDSSGGHTDLQLKQHESAAVVKIPVTLKSSEPVNCNVRQYDAAGIVIALNGRGQTQIRIETGPFVVQPGKTYQVMIDKARDVVAGDDGTLDVALTLVGPTTLKIGNHD